METLTREDALIQALKLKKVEINNAQMRTMAGEAMAAYACKVMDYVIDLAEQILKGEE